MKKLMMFVIYSLFWKRRAPSIMKGIEMVELS